MDEWNTRQHGGSGLTQRVRDSQISTEEAEAQTLAFLEQWVPKGKSPICGNSICQDRRFLYRRMPRLEAYFHYRNLDVSTLKELAARWAPEVLAGESRANDRVDGAWSLSNLCSHRVGLQLGHGLYGLSQHQHVHTRIGRHTRCCSVHV